MLFVLTEGQRNEMVGFWPLMEQGEVKRSGRGRAKLRPRRICADKGYAKGVVQALLEAIGHKDHDSQKVQRASRRAV